MVAAMNASGLARAPGCGGSSTSARTPERCIHGPFTEVAQTRSPPVVAIEQEGASQVRCHRFAVTFKSQIGDGALRKLSA
jgi:hypothetical protein